MHARFLESRIRRALTSSVITGIVLAFLCVAVLPMTLLDRPVMIHVRWAPDVVESRRIELERRFRLEEGRPIEGTTWAYRLADTSIANIRALVEDDRVEDTHDLDRSQFRPVVARERSRHVWVYAGTVGAAGAALLFAWLVGMHSLLAALLGRWAARFGLLLAQLRAIVARHRRIALSLAAASIGVIAFAFRLITLDTFSPDHYMHLAFAQQLLSGEVPNRDFVDPGYLLTYSLSALVQLFWPGPLSEAVLTIAMLSITAVLTFLVVEAVTGSMAAAIAAGTFCAVIQPELFNYPKFLAPAVALWLLTRHVAHPSRWRISAMAIWTTASFLFRYDLGLYVGVATIGGLLAAHWRPIRTARYWIAWYLAVGMLSVLPYLAFAQWTEGMSGKIRDAFQYFAQETTPLAIPRLEFPFLATWNLLDWNRLDSAATLFHLARLLALVAVVVLAVRWRKQRPGAGPVIAAAVVLLAAYDLLILRDPVFNRIRDLGVPMAVVGGWLGWDLWRASMTTQRYARAVPIACVALVAAAAFGSAWNLARVTSQIREKKILQGWAAVHQQTSDMLERTSTWARFWPYGELPEVIGYLDRCTATSDHLLFTGANPEYYVFARRPFAAGIVLLRSFNSPGDQALMLSRLQHQNVPVVLIDERNDQDFAHSYRILYAYLVHHYTPVARFRGHHGSPIAVAIRRDLRATGSYGVTGWPCDFVQSTTSGDDLVH